MKKKKIGGVKRSRASEPEKRASYEAVSDGSLLAARLSAKYMLDVDREQYVVIFKCRQKGEAGSGSWVEHYTAFSPWGAGIAEVSPLFTEIERWHSGTNPLEGDTTHGKT